MHEYFPLFIHLKGAKILLIGNSAHIEQKQARLVGFSPILTRIDASADAAAAIAAIRPQLVVMDFSEFSEDIYRFCLSQGIAVNCIDRAELSTCIFPAVLQKGSLGIGISTQGKAPAAAVAVRDYLDRILPDDTEALLDEIIRVRREMQSRGVPKDEAARILRNLMQNALNNT